MDLAKIMFGGSNNLPSEETMCLTFEETKLNDFFETFELRREFINTDLLSYFRLILQQLRGEIVDW